MNWFPDCRPVLVAAVSGRALAAAARRAGFVPLVADLFGDLDTQAMAAKAIRLPGTLSEGLQREPLLAALERLAEDRDTEGLVYGSGFEDRTGLLEEIGKRHTLIGNVAETVTRLKDPMAFAGLCRHAGLPHPEIRNNRPSRGRWLEKRAGGTGGMHVRSWSSEPSPDGIYYQQHVEGRAVSALFLADGALALLLGFSQQWADPTPASPFRYGGAASPACVPDAQARTIAAGLTKLVGASSLVGLCSADFLLRPDGFHLLEINPRPGATLDLYQNANLFRWHVDACRGRLPDAVLPPVRAAAAAVVYARDMILLRDGFNWPEWTADRQPPGEAVPPGAPLCTVMAGADTAKLARRCVQARAAAILSLAGASP